MRPLQHEIQIILKSAGGVIARREHPDLAEALSWLARRGDLRSVLPGVYAHASISDDVMVRIRAAMLWSPDVVLTGTAAARVSFWPQIRVGPIGLAQTPQCRGMPTGYRMSRGLLPAELIEESGGLRFTTPALTALDLCETHGGDGIDTALRTRAATLDDIRAAMELTTGRMGNALRRQLLDDSRDKPWSAAERLSHRLLREAGLVGWRTNLEVLGDGQSYFLDVAFEEERVILEIDGRLHEEDKLLFESDRWRQNYLVLDGWRVLRFTWAMLTEHPEYVIKTVLAALNPIVSR